MQPNGWRLSCRTDNFQNIQNETGFHAENEINSRHSYEIQTSNNKNLNPPQAMRNVPRSSGQLEPLVRQHYFLNESCNLFFSVLVNKIDSSGYSPHPRIILQIGCHFEFIITSLIKNDLLLCSVNIRSGLKCFSWKTQLR